MLGVRFFFFGCNNSFCGCNISFCSYNISFCGCNISFCGYNISFCGCNNSKSDCYILFSACSKSKRDLCFSYATTYNLVDAFLSFKVLHETDAQRLTACGSCVNLTLNFTSTKLLMNFRRKFKQRPSRAIATSRC